MEKTIKEVIETIKTEMKYCDVKIAEGTKVASYESRKYTFEEVLEMLKETEKGKIAMETKTILLCGGSVTIDADCIKEFTEKLKELRRDFELDMPCSRVCEISKTEMMKIVGVISIDCESHCFAV